MLVRAHLVAMSVWGVLWSALTACLLIQILVPGIAGGVSVLTYGRVAIAAALVVRLGWMGNGAFIALYRLAPSIADAATRSTVGVWLVGLWNLTIVAPFVYVALAGLHPPLQALSPWFSAGEVADLALFMAVLVPTLITVRPEIEVDPARRATAAVFGVSMTGSLLIVVYSVGSGLLAMSAFKSHEAWFASLPTATFLAAVGLVGALFIGAGCVRWLRAAARPSADGTGWEDANLFRSRRWRNAMASVFLPVLVILPLLDSSSPLNGPTTLTPSESLGRVVFMREGCESCHLDSHYQTGIAPTLAHESGVHPTDWQFAHLYAPRSVTPKTVMPSFARLFNGSVDRPTAEARNLVAYLETLGRASHLGVPEAKILVADLVRARRATDMPLWLSDAGDRELGAREYLKHCAGCHGTTGKGDGPAATGLKPRPADLTAHRYTRERVADALWNGVAGSSMAAWRTLSSAQLAATAETVRHFGDDAAAKLVESEAPSPSALELGARVYAANCSQCHGEHGAGDGFSAASLPMAPANFQRQQPSLGQALAAIGHGVEGTPMAPWLARLDGPEVLAVAHYVRSLYGGHSR